MGEGKPCGLPCLALPPRERFLEIDVKTMSTPIPIPIFLPFVFLSFVFLRFIFLPAGLFCEQADS